MEIKKIFCHRKVGNGIVSKKETQGGMVLPLLSPTVTGVRAYDVNVTS